MLDPKPIRRLLMRWYERHQRALPWRSTSDPYRIWASEIMLQQTRVAAVIPYYERFLSRFPDPAALAAASEDELLSAWAGLGYYSRARNMQKAARAVVESGGFPRDYAAIRALPGIGDYTASAVASIAFGLPHAVLDGNVMRVLARLSNDPGDIQARVTRQRLQELADELLDRRDPGGFNQALMEIGATVCLPRQPLCDECPLLEHCSARREGVEKQLPVKLKRVKQTRIERTLLIVERRGSLLLWQRNGAAKKLRGFWELPEPEHLPDAEPGAPLGAFRHSIMNHDYCFNVHRAATRRIPSGFQWVEKGHLAGMPLSTVVRKALSLLAHVKSK